MLRFILTRLFQALLVIMIFLAILFVALRLTGDPAARFMPPDATQEDYQMVRARFGLDEPIYVQYGLFLGGVCKGDFGRSIFTKRLVIDSIKEKLPNSARLVAVSTLMAFIAVLPLGVMAAVRKKRPIDTFARVIAAMGQSLPSFWVGLMLMELFAVWLGILPVSGMGDWRCYLMPATVLGFSLMAGPLRLLRSSMLESLGSEYITLARIKGVSENIIAWKHALRNSAIPVLTYSALSIAVLMTGSITTEVVFAWPGIGQLAYRAVLNQDFPLIQGVLLTMVLVVVVANLAVDILYAYVDPRIRLRA